MIALKNYLIINEINFLFKFERMIVINFKRVVKRLRKFVFFFKSKLSIIQIERMYLGIIFFITLATQ